MLQGVLRPWCWSWEPWFGVTPISAIAEGHQKGVVLHSSLISPPSPLRGLQITPEQMATEFQ